MAPSPSPASLGLGAYEIQSKFLAGLAQLRRGPQPTLPVPGLAKVVVTWQSSHHQSTEALLTPKLLFSHL